MGTEGEENKPTAWPLAHRLHQGGGTKGGTLAPTLLPAHHLTSPKDTADLSKVTHVQHALLGHSELEQLAVERSSQLRKPSSETSLDVTAFLFSYSPQHQQEKKVMGLFPMWKFMLNTLSSWGNGLLQQ